MYVCVRACGVCMYEKEWDLERENIYVPFLPFSLWGTVIVIHALLKSAARWDLH